MPRLLIAAFISLLALSPVATSMTPAQIRSCNALAQGFSGKATEYEAAKASRDEAAAAAELAGEAWEAAEELRLFGAEQASDADEAYAAYEAAKVEFETIEAAVREQGASLNAEIATYNTRCVTD